MAWQLIERADSRYPGGAGFSFENSRSMVVYIAGVETAQDVHDMLTNILGGVDFNGAGRLARTLPKANPFFPHHFAARISSITGIGVNSVGTTEFDFAADPIASYSTDPLASQFALYKSPRGFYELRIEFEPRTYQVLPDDDVAGSNLSYYEVDGSAAIGFNGREYERFVTPETTPAPTLAYAQLGQLQFFTGTGTVSDSTPHPKVFPGFPFTVLPDGQFSLTWHQVPYSLIDDSTHPMNTYIGKVNQTEFFGRRPGSLLYMGAKVVRRYLPPVPNIDITAQGVTFRQEFLCDLQFNFNFTARTVTDPPTFTNRNWITDGWNCQPYRLNGKFYYVGTGNSETNYRTPNHLSAPMELLFRCPTDADA